MKYSKTLLALLLCSVILTILSCSKSVKEKPSSNLAGKLKFIHFVSDHDKHTSEYQYDHQGFLISLNHTYPNAINNSRNEFSNDSVGKPVLSFIYATKAGGSLEKYATVNYTYKADKLIEYKQFRADGKLQFNQEYKYNNQNFLESSTLTLNNEIQGLYVYETYEYTVDSKGILTGKTRKTYPTGPGAAIYITTEKYEYDDKVNPMSPYFAAIYVPNNNIKTTVKHDKIPNELVNIFAFDYNADGLPVKEYAVDNGSKTLIRLYEYY